MQTITLSSENSETVIKKAVEILQQGGLIVAPSDTVYGLLVDATNEEAVKKLIAFKNRPIGKSISVFVKDFAMLENEVYVNDQQKKTLSHLLPGPFTVVLPSQHHVSKLIESEKGTLGVRLIQYPFIIELVKAFGKPITATSANLSGKSPHHSLQSLLNQLSEVKKELIDLAIDAGQLPKNKPSTVIDLTSSTVKILRQGDVVWENEETFVTKSPQQTKKTAQFILEKIAKETSQKPVVMILKGDLGAGKTVFVQGLAEQLGIDEVISPTFTIYYEYKIKNNFFENLYHFDLYNVEDPEEFKYLGIADYLKPHNLLCFEWGEKAGDLLDLFKKNATVFFVEIQYIDQESRKIIIKELVT